MTDNAPVTFENNAAYAAAEKKASKTVDIAPFRWLLLAVLALYVVALVLPYSGDIRGWEVVTRATDVQVGIAETVFAWFSAAAAFVGVGLILLTKRTVIANITYLVSGIALIVSLFSLWMRIQSAQNDGTSGVGIGHLVSVASIILLVYTLSRLVFSRSESQVQAAQQRAANYQLDSVGLAQQAHSLSQGFDTADTNPLLVDDRRQRAAKRHEQQD